MSSTKTWVSTSAGENVAVRLSPPDSISTRSTAVAASPSVGRDRPDVRAAGEHSVDGGNNFVGSVVVDDFFKKLNNPIDIKMIVAKANPIQKAFFIVFLSVDLNVLRLTADV